MLKGNISYDILIDVYIAALTPVPLLLMNFLAGKEKPSFTQLSE